MSYFSRLRHFKNSSATLQTFDVDNEVLVLAWGSLKCEVPLTHDLESDGTASFFFTQGSVKTTIPPGYEDFFGEPPYFAFLDTPAIRNMENYGLLTSSLSKPEEALRFLGHQSVVDALSLVDALSYLHRVVEEEGPFQGILGFSEGGCVAATFLLDYNRRCEAQKVESMFKMAIFFGSTAPFTSDGKSYILADEYGPVFSIPTIHVIGSTDPLLTWAMELYDLCEPEKATLFDHGKGHQLIWDPKIVRRLANVVRRVASQAVEA